MEDIAARISSLLNRPDAMEQLQAAAKTLLGESQDSVQTKESASENKNESNQFSIPQGLFDNIGNMQGIIRIIGLLQNKKEDKRTSLLLALKPHLSAERAARVDRAVSFLRIAEVLPILREEGLFDSLGF